MASNGAHSTGTALLLAAAPAGKGRLMDAGSAVPALAAVPPNAWTGTAAATLIELTDPVEPQAVLTRLRAAAAVEVPLTVVLIGQLVRDRRQHGVHLALARTTPTSVRYTALPWTWLLQALQLRRPDTTTVYADLVADAEVWEQLDDGPLDFGHSTLAYGLISPPPRGRRIAQPRYTQAMAQILRAGQRPGPEQLHLAAIRESDTESAMIVAPQKPQNIPANAPAPPVRPPARPVVPPQPQRSVSPVYVPTNRVVPVIEDPHPRIAAASRAGRHQEAARLAAAAEREAHQLYGSGTVAGIHWTEVRAYVAAVAQDHAGSCELWLAAGYAWLNSLQQAPDSPDVEAAADKAHYEWDRIGDRVRARELAPALIALRQQVPGRQPGALQLLQTRLARL